MDWEKKTFSRAQLKGAAASAFNGLHTPGQALLGALQDAEVERKDRLGNTVSAKMKAAREQLPDLEPHRPPKSDVTIFGDHKAEVHGLLAYPPPPTKVTGMTGVKEMLERRGQRHQAVMDWLAGVVAQCKDELQRVYADQAGDLRVRLTTSEAHMEADMDVLADEKVTMLEFAEVQQVWSSVSHRLGRRQHWLGDFEQELQTAEERWRVTTEKALTDFAAALNEVAHISPGEVERVLEKEALALNTGLLANRREVADLMERLHVAEVKQEVARKERFQGALARWRVLRTHHAMAQFNERLAATSFQEPPQRLALFGQLRASQQEAFDKIVSHCEDVPSLLPPHLRPSKVERWTAAAQQIHASWEQQAALEIQRLQNHEDGVEEAVGNMLEALRQEVLGYEGFPEEELAQLLDSCCSPGIRTRREAALQLLERAKLFLGAQAAQWREMTGAVGSWLAAVAEVFVGHKEATTNMSNDVKAALKAAREQFEVDDAAREKTLEEATQAVTQGSSEKVLERSVAEAAEKLAAIEAGYRALHSRMTSIVSAFAPDALLHNDHYQVELCGLLRLRPNVLLPGQEPPAPDPPPPPPVVPQPPPPTPPLATPEPPPPAAQPLPVQSPKPKEKAAAKGKAVKGKGKAEPPPPPPVEEPPPPPVIVAPPTPPPPPPPPPSVELNSGEKFIILQDLLSQLLPKLAQADATLPGSPAPAAGAAQQQAPFPGSPAPADGAPGVPPPSEEGAISEDSRSPLPPTSRAGLDLCAQIRPPVQKLKGVLQQVQLTMLEEAQEFAHRVVGAAEGWAQEREVEYTEELDEHLRHHRPRLGRIEEEVRAARSVELMGQRRKVESHLRAMSRVAKEQQTAAAEALVKSRAAVQKSITRLTSFETFLKQCLSVKGLEIRQREAETLLLRIQKEVAEQVKKLQEDVQAACSGIVEGNRKFAADTLRTFEDGGVYAPENVAVYRQAVDGVEAHMVEQQRQQEEAITKLGGELDAKAAAALEAVQQLLPSYKEDLAFIEVLDKHMEGARKKAHVELSKNRDTQVALDAELEAMEKLLTSSSSVPTADEAALQHCAKLLSSSDRLRRRLLAQARMLDYLQSAGLTAPGVEVEAILEEGADIPAVQAAERPVSSASPTRPGSGSKPARPTSPNKGAKKDAPKAGKQAAKGKAEAVIAPPQVEGLVLEADISACIAGAKHEVGQVAKDYYAKREPKPEPKGKAKEEVKPEPIRPIRFPQRIPETVEQLLKQTEDMLGDLRDQLSSHLAAGRQLLRIQTIRANRLLERLPSTTIGLMMRHLSDVAAAEQLELRQGFEARHAEVISTMQKHQRTLHPGMVHPNRQHELEGLRAQEEQRAEASKALTREFAQALLTQVATQGPRISSKVQQLVAITMQLLDSFLMPADLPPSPGADLDIPLPHKSLWELHDLAQAQEDGAGLAEGAVPPGGPPEPAKKGAKPPAAAPKAAKGAAPVEAPAAPRPFNSMTWVLQNGNLDVASLGWAESDSTAAAVDPAAVQAAATSSSREAATLAGLDTPLHRLLIVSHKAAVVQLEQLLAAAVATGRGMCRHWLEEESMWADTWQRLLRDLDDM